MPRVSGRSPPGIRMDTTVLVASIDRPTSYDAIDRIE